MVQTAMSPFMVLAPLVGLALAMRAVGWLADRPALLLRLLRAPPAAIVWAMAGARPSASTAPRGDEPPPDDRPKFGPDRVHKPFVPLHVTPGFTNYR